MKCRLSTIMLLMMCILGIWTCSVYAAPLNITARSAILADLRTGQVYWSKEPNMRVYPASITKLMTAMLVLEDGRLNKQVIISEKAEWTDGTAIWAEEGEPIRIVDLLYGMMIVSGNDASVALAEGLQGDEGVFVEMMNQKAKELGALSTNFENVHGLHEDLHYTTAADFARIARAAWNTPGMAEILQTREYSAPMLHRDETRVFTTSNYLLDEFEGMLGGKNGYTDEAGRTFVGYAQRDDLALLCIVFDAEDHYIDASMLLEYGFENIGSYEVFDDVTEIPSPYGVLRVVYSPTVRGIQRKQANRVLRLSPLNRSESSIAARFYEYGFDTKAVVMRPKNSNVGSAPVWKSPIFGISILFVLWVAIFGFYRLIGASISSLKEKGQ